MENRTEKELYPEEKIVMLPLSQINKIERNRTKFHRFFSNVSMLSVADTTPIDTQIELMNALKEVE